MRKATDFYEEILKIQQALQEKIFFLFGLILLNLM